MAPGSRFDCLLHNVSFPFEEAKAFQSSAEPSNQKTPLYRQGEFCYSLPWSPVIGLAARQEERAFMVTGSETRVGLTTLLSKERLRTLYTDALRMRLVLDEKISMKLRGQHEIGGFFIGGMGEEIHGMATAQALWDGLGLPIGGQLRILLDSFSTTVRILYWTLRFASKESRMAR